MPHRKYSIKQRSDQAQTIPEYALLITFMAIFTIAAMSQLGTDLVASFNQFGTLLTAIVAGV
jgi:Flp pilus assembly pilin Flp